MPHDREHVLADVAKGDASHVERAIAAAREGARRVVGDAVARARRGVPPRRRAARRPVALDAQRGDDAQPVEDRASGRDRRRLRDDRLPPLQRRVPRADLRGAADLVARRLEPAGVPPARGLRLRDQPVQLHGDRRQPDDLAGADGQHGRVEARLDAGALRVVHAAAARGGRAAARRDQPRLRPGRRARRLPRSRARSSPASTSPARPASSSRSGGRSAAASTATGTTRGSSARPAARTSSSPTPPPTPSAVATAIVRGSFEYQGQKCSASSRLYLPSNLWERDPREPRARRPLDRDGRRRATSRTSWAP